MVSQLLLFTFCQHFNNCLLTFSSVFVYIASTVCLHILHKPIFFFRSFVPPVRDEESETQRKAHAKRVRETRRSTQGVTLEDLKSAEQLVKKKQQQENQQRTSELQQLVASQQQKSSPTPPTASTVVSHTGK